MPPWSRRRGRWYGADSWRFLGYGLSHDKCSELSLDLFFRQPAAPDHHPILLGNISDVLERVGLEQDQVGPFPERDGPRRGLVPKEPRDVAGAGGERLVRSEPGPNIGGELPGQRESRRVPELGSIRAEGHPHAAVVECLEDLAPQRDEALAGRPRGGGGGGPPPRPRGGAP